MTQPVRLGKLPTVWILSELYFPEQTVPAPILTSIAEGLAPRVRVRIICCQPTYSARGTVAPKREERNRVLIRRVSSTTLDKDNLFYRVINLFTISIAISFTSLRLVRRGDIVLVVTNPPLLPFLAVVVCRVRRAKSILLVHDVYPEILIRAGITGPRSLLSRIGYQLTRKLYRSSDCVVVLGRDMARLAAMKIGRSSGKIEIIPNWADIDSIAPRERNQNHLLAALRLTDRFVVQYSGNMGRTHGLEDLCQAAKDLDGLHEIHFLFIGSGAKRGWLEKRFRDEGISNSTILPPRLRKDLADSLNACDVAVIAYVAGMSGVSVPSRMYNIMAAGKPIIAIADSDSELALLIAEEDAGWVVPPGHREWLVRTILHAHSHPDECRAKGLNGRRAVEVKYTFRQSLAMYDRLIREMGIQ